MEIYGREKLRSVILGAVRAARTGADDEAILLCGTLTAGLGDTSRNSVLELARANVEMLISLVGMPTEERPLFVVDGEDAEGAAVRIDEFEPAQRAATRIMLAIAHDRPADAEMQLDIVVNVPGPAEMRLVLVHTLCWTLELLDICVERSRPVPGWLRPIAA